MTEERLKEGQLVRLKPEFESPTHHPMTHDLQPGDLLLVKSVNPHHFGVELFNMRNFRHYSNWNARANLWEIVEEAQ